MKKLALAFAAALLSISAVTPVFAAETDNNLDQVVTNVSLMPARVIGLAAGAGIGIPIATVRATVERTASIRNKISESLPDTDSPANKAYSTVLAVPAGLLAGVVDGSYYGLVNATKGFEHPFSADSFSLADKELAN
jgi:hypothetical protein